MAKELVLLLESNVQAPPSDRISVQQSAGSSWIARATGTSGFLSESQRLKDAELAEHVEQLSEAEIDAMLTEMLNETGPPK
jgi:hypothetical protein